MNTELIERYLSEVGRHLPPKNRTDILAELRSLIMDKLDERVPEGQPKQADLVEVLLAMGSPRKVAASFAGERYLIGPELYPSMIQVMQIVALALLVLPVLGLWEMFTTDFATLNAAIEFGVGQVAQYFGAAINAFGMIVLVFAVLERQKVNLSLNNEEQWHPDQLPPLHQSSNVDYVGMAVELAFSFVGLAFVWYLYQQGGLPYFLYAGAPGGLIPIDRGLLLAIILIELASILIQLFTIYRGRWYLLTRVAETLLSLVGVYVVYLATMQVAAQIGAYLPPLSDLRFEEWPLGLAFGLIATIILVDGAVKVYRLLTVRPEALPLAAPTPKLG